MKILIATGMVIVFISAFFMLFIFDSIIKNQIACLASLGESGCNTTESMKSLVIGLSLIAMFLIVDSGVLYVIIKAITSSGSAYIAYSV